MGETDHGAHEPHPADRSDVGDLLVRVAHGDQEAFTGVYEALARPVMGLVCRVLRDVAQAEEVTQDVMVEIWRTAGRYRPERGTAKAWALTLAHRRAVDRVRHVHAEVQRERRVGARITGREYDEVAEAVAGHEERQGVRRCLGELARPYRVPLLLAYYQGLTYLEVAASLSAPAGTVKSRMRTALRLLRECLEARS